MPFHFCSDELFAIMSMLPFIGVGIAKLRALWHAHHAQKTCVHVEQHREVG